MLTVMIVLGSLVYANIGIAVGFHIHRKPGLDLNDSPAPLLGGIWPVFFCGMMILIPKYLKIHREKKQARELEEKPVKMLPPPENHDSPVDTAEKFIALQEEAGPVGARSFRIGQTDG